MMMNKGVFVLVVLFLSFCLAQEPALKRWYSREIQGMQDIDSSLSYAGNLITNGDYIYMRADKAVPNVFTAVSEGSQDKQFYLYTHSQLLKGTYPYVAFDVITKQDREYIIGPTLGQVDTPEVPLGLPLLVSIPGNSPRNSPLYTQLKNVFLYNVVFDKTRSTDTTLYFYAVGWQYTKDLPAVPGLVVLRGKVFITGDPSILIEETDIYTLNKQCYDVWTETNLPKMFINNGGDYLIVGIPGRCNAFYKIQIPPVTASFNNAPYTSYIPPYDAAMEIDSFTFSHVANRIFFATKLYNSDEITIGYIDTSKTGNLSSVFPFGPQKLNETTPILAIDEVTGNLFVATSGFNEIVQYQFEAGTDKYTFTVAVLPQKVKHVSDMMVYGDNVYFTTWEPDAQLARVAKTNFCLAYCSDNGFCSNGECVCVNGFEQDPLTDVPNCLPTHIIKEIDQMLFNAGASTTFGILFIFTLLGAASGWFVWYRKSREVARV